MPVSKRRDYLLTIESVNQAQWAHWPGKLVSTDSFDVADKSVRFVVRADFY
jgi:hypothetical protein